jgi:hypothetical protein
MLFPEQITKLLPPAFASGVGLTTTEVLAPALQPVLSVIKTE